MRAAIYFLILVFSSASFGEECTKELAFEAGIKAIKLKFPNYMEKAPYKIEKWYGSWLVFGSLPPDTVGGTPQAKVDIQSCKVLETLHGQ
ncbi:NTF2 fold immunity protein [Microbulbifer aestuariivivens]|uniref:NTF2 fold immunity protein n=1 Tax=Microbulbifer aestuariivivens TaxID=1908308 RepID=UPI0031F11056